MKKFITCTSEEIELGTYKTDLGVLITKLQEIQKEFPDDAELCGCVSGYEDEYYTICFTYKREETDYEYQDRLSKEKWEKKRLEDDELETYRRLKAKFGG